MAEEEKMHCYKNTLPTLKTFFIRRFSNDHFARLNAIAKIAET